LDPESTLRRLCRRHDVPWASARRLLPLIRRAAQSPAPLRRNLLQVVEATLRRDAEELGRREQLERQALIAIAHALHAWPDA
jgi:transposase-like protein